MNYFLGNVILSILNIRWIDTFITNFLFWRISNLKLTVPQNPRLFWGITPIINFSVYSRSLKKSYKSDTIVNGLYSINKKTDFDYYCEEILSANFKMWPKFLKYRYRNFLLLKYAVTNYDIFHLSCNGLFFGATPFYKRELQLLQKLNKKIVILPYGGDAAMYSKIYDLSYRHALLISYPEEAKKEVFIAERFTFLTQIADCMFSGSFVDGVGRWDVLMPMVYGIDTEKWKKKVEYNTSDGINGCVKIMHTPNHRGVKGTEFVLQAIQELKQEGLNIELILIEKRTNDEVQKIMFEQADILVEQLICIGHGVSAIEGLSTGIPVLSNLSDEHNTRVFRRYSFLNECPIVSTNPETVKNNLKLLITQPQLRNKLGDAGRQYVEKYYTYDTMAFVFESIYKKIWFKQNIDLLNIFHPVMPNSYNNQTYVVKHPLINNLIPNN